MNYSDSVTLAGNKISAFVGEKGGNVSKVDECVKKCNQELENIRESKSQNKAPEDDNEVSEYDEVGTATAELFDSFKEMIEIFKTEDPKEIAKSVLTALEKVSTFATTALPVLSKVLKPLVGPMSFILSALLGAGTKKENSEDEPTESDEDILKKIIEEALDVEEFKDLQDSASGFLKELGENMSSVQGYLDAADDLGDGDRMVIRMMPQGLGSVFIGALKSHIQREMGLIDINSNEDIAKRTATLITVYSNVAYVRYKYLLMLSCLIGGDPTANRTAFNVGKLGKDQKAACKKFLSQFLDRPIESNRVVYSKLCIHRIHHPSSFDSIEALCGVAFRGKMVAIYNHKRRKYLEVKSPQEESTKDPWPHHVFTTKEKKFNDIIGGVDAKKFIIFERGPSENDEIEIFSLAFHGYIGYIFGNISHGVDINRNRVKSINWNIKDSRTEKIEPGEESKNGTFKVSRGAQFGSVYLYKGINLKQVMYAENPDPESGASETAYPVYTWEPQGPKDDGLWIFEDLLPRLNSTRMTIENEDSNHVLNGRNTDEDKVWLTEPMDSSERYFDYSNWIFIKLNDFNDYVTYNIKSYTSNRYLGSEEKKPDSATITHLTSEEARTNSNYRWRIRKYKHDQTKERFSIQNDSSELYMNGSNPYKGLELDAKLSGAGNDPDFMWKIESSDGSKDFLKNMISLE